jgi:hypothetical protein
VSRPQHASIVVNMHLRWNPAVPHHRRRHAFFLAFKKSLLAGVLDGAEREAFLGGAMVEGTVSGDTSCGAGQFHPLMTVKLFIRNGDICSDRF